MKISIVIGYRNREAARVRNCLDSLRNQSFVDFELIFIDYGSDSFYSKEIKELVESYSYAKYFYNSTQGMPWNRAHALNTGVRLAKGEYILFGDIDLMYSASVLEALYEQVEPNIQVYSTVYFLKKGQANLTTIMNGEWQSIDSSDDNGKGGVHLVARKHLEQIRGYDEYYCFWGVEDRDLYSRLDQLEIESRWIDKSKNPVFHQWHPNASGMKKGFFPDRWWESMNFHFQLNINTLERNKDNWGKLLTENDRSVLAAKEIVFQYRYKAKWFYKGIVVSDLVKAIQELKTGQCLSITIPNRDIHVNKKLLFLNKTIQPFFPSYEVVSKNFEIFKPQIDLMYIVWKLIKEEDLIVDYFIEQNNEKTIIKIM